MRAAIASSRARIDQGMYLVSGDGGRSVSVGCKTSPRVSTRLRG